MVTRPDHTQVEAAFCLLEGITYHINTRTTRADTHEYCAREAGQIEGTMATLRGSPVERMSRESEILVSRSRNHEPVTHHIFVIVRRVGCSCMEDLGNPNHPNSGIVELFKIFSPGFPLLLDF